MLKGNFPDEAGRLAYGAALNAARAYVFELTDRVHKTHSGTHGEFARMIKDHTGFTAAQRSFLGQSYKLKSAADYGDGQPADHDAAVDAIGGARAFVASIEAALAAHEKEKETP